jgi:hypothetical protein
MSDAYLNLDDIGEKGIDMNIQVNNIADEAYHRLNGFSRFKTIRTLDLFLEQQYDLMI